MKYISRLILGLATALLVAACGGGGGGGSATPTLPSDAVTITEANADAVANTAVGTLQTLGSINAAEANAAPSTLQVINIVTDKVFDRSRHSQLIVTGVSDTQTYSCSSGGSVTISYNYTDTTDSGTVTFNNCTEYSVTINGTIRYSSTWNNSTGAYHDTANGSITYIYNSTTFSIVMNYDETGNEINYTYSTNISYSVSGIPGGGFLVTTTQNITGYWYGDVTGGQIIVQGAGGTRLRITVTAPNIATVEFDDGSGSFVTRPSTIYIYYY